MKRFQYGAGLLTAMLLVSACATTAVTSRQEYAGPALARPDRIIVYSFAATPEEIPSWSSAAREYAHAAPLSGEALQNGRNLGRLVAQELVSDIREMGLRAVHAAGEPGPRPGDLALLGYFVTVDEGSAAKRVALGFGSGAAEMKVKVEGYLATEQGMRRLGAGEVDSGGGKAPGVVVPLAVTIATANPLGLIVGGAVKAGGELSGRSTIEGTAERTAEKISSELEIKFAEQGWIPKR